MVPTAGGPQVDVVPVVRAVGSFGGEPPSLVVVPPGCSYGPAAASTPPACTASSATPEPLGAGFTTTLRVYGHQGTMGQLGNGVVHFEVPLRWYPAGTADAMTVPLQLTYTFGG